MRWGFESADAERSYEARRDLLAYLRSRAADESDLEGAMLVFGELIGNVVRHAPGPISIDLRWDPDGCAVLRVADRGPGFSLDGDARLPDPLAESGRGLFIAGSVAQRLLVERRPDGGTQATAWLPVTLRSLGEASA